MYSRKGKTSQRGMCLSRSRAAFTYQEAQARIDDARMIDELSVGLRAMNAYAKKRRRARADMGALQLASPEVKFQIDTETQNPLDVGMYQVFARSLCSCLASCLCLQWCVNLYPATKSWPMIDINLKCCCSIVRLPLPPVINSVLLLNSSPHTDLYYLHNLIVQASAGIAVHAAATQLACMTSRPGTCR